MDFTLGAVVSKSLAFEISESGEYFNNSTNQSLNLNLNAAVSYEKRNLKRILFTTVIGVTKQLKGQKGCNFLKGE